MSNQKTSASTDANSAAVIDSFANQGTVVTNHELLGQTAPLPGTMKKFKQRFFPDARPATNADVKVSYETREYVNKDGDTVEKLVLDKASRAALPKHVQVQDPRTGLTKSDVRFISSKGNIVVKH